ncbi:MAG: hypothetical protein AAGE43_09735, partial [Pseudomonadota bacterium]
MAITANTPVEQVAALVSQALEDAGISATLSGGGAVSVYSNNEYQSRDLDFVTSEGLESIDAAIEHLGFYRTNKHARQFDHPESKWYLEFPPGPLAFGFMVVDHGDL